MKKLILSVVLLLASQIIFSQTTDPSPYCDASFDDAEGYYVDDHINSVSFGTLNNVTNSQYAAPHYVFYNNLSVADFIPGTSYSLTINFTTAGGCGYGVWIDYNQNNIFETSEKIAGTTGYDMLEVGANPTITKSITIPSTATPGNTRMRVRIVEDDNHHMTTTDELPCNASTSATDIMDWGETEDYTINIKSSDVTDPSPYCDASFDDAEGYYVDDHINSVSFGTLNNVTNSQYAAPHYIFYDKLSVANFIRGNAYTLTVNFTTAGGCGYGVWIDYNQNNIFETSEKIAGTTGYEMLEVGGSPTITKSITIPSTATPGNTRMRVRIVEDDNYNMTTTDILPCNASTSATDIMDWGETEDYTINIEIESPDGINELNEVNNIVIYPNPANTTLMISQSEAANITYKIINVLGQVIQTGAINNSNRQINVSTFEEGIYYIQLFESTKYLGQRKFVKTDK